MWHNCKFPIYMLCLQAHLLHCILLQHHTMNDFHVRNDFGKVKSSIQFACSFAVNIYSLLQFFMICELVNWIVSNAKFVRWQTKDNAKARITIENNDHFIESTAYDYAQCMCYFFLSIVWNFLLLFLYTRHWNKYLNK